MLLLPNESKNFRIEPFLAYIDLIGAGMYSFTRRISKRMQQMSTFFLKQSLSQK